MLNHCKQIAARVWKDESGTETLEYALIIGLVVVGCIALVGKVGVKAVARWTTVKKAAI